MRVLTCAFFCQALKRGGGAMATQLLATAAVALKDVLVRDGRDRFARLNGPSFLPCSMP